MRIKTKNEEDARFMCDALKAIGVDVDWYYGGCGVSENGPTRGYWTIIIALKEDYRMLRDWFPDRPFIYSTTRKKTVWKKSQNITT